MIMGMVAHQVSELKEPRNSRGKVANLGSSDEENSLDIFFCQVLSHFYSVGTGSVIEAQNETSRLERVSSEGSIKPHYRAASNCHAYADKRFASEFKKYLN